MKLYDHTTDRDTEVSQLSNDALAAHLTRVQQPEFTELAAHFPVYARRIDALTAEAAARGV